MKLIESLLNAHFMRFASSFEKNLKNFKKSVDIKTICIYNS